MISIDKIEDLLGKLAYACEEDKLPLISELKSNLQDVKKSIAKSAGTERSGELDKSESFYKLLFDRAGDAICLLEDGKFSDCNEMALEVYGLDSMDDIIGKPPYEFSPEFQPDGRHSAEKAAEMINLACENGTHRFEWMHLNKKTGLIHTDILLSSFSEKGRNLLLVSLRDITEQKMADAKLRQSEANLAAAINYSNYATGIFSEDGRLKQYNSKFASIVKAVSGIDISSDISAAQIFKFNQAASWDEKVSLISRGETIRFEHSIDINGDTQYYDFTINPAMDSGRIISFNVFISEITKFKLTEKLLKAENLKLEGQVREQSTELRMQTDLFATLIDSVPDLIFIKDVNGVYLHCNKAFSNFFNKSPNEIIGKTDHDIYRADEVVEILRFDKEALAVDFSTKEEQLLTAYDGNAVFFDTVKTPFKNEDGKPIGLIGISRDISDFKKLENDIKSINLELEGIIDKRTAHLKQEIQERTRAEEALKKSRQMYKDLFNSIPIGIYRIALDGRIILANPALAKMLECTNYSNLKQMNLNESGTVDKNERQAIINAVLASGTLNEFETTWHKCSGGEIFMQEKIKAVTDSETNSVYIEGIVEDITARKVAEKMQQTVYKISEAAYKVEKIEELYRLIHQSVSSLISCKNFYIAIYDDSKKEISFPYLVDEFDSPVASQFGPYPLSNGLTEYVISTGTYHLLDSEDIHRLEKAEECKVIGTHPTSWLGVPLRTIKNKTIGVIAVQSYDESVKYDSSAKDILVFVSTQIANAIYRKQIEEALQSEREYLAERVLERTEELSALNAELSRAVRTKDEFLANMSHELRTPLNAVLGLSEILLKHKDFSESEKHRRALTTIRESGGHLLNLINDILDLSKIEAGKMEMNFEELKLENMCSTSINFVRQLAMKKSIDISLSIAEECPDTFWGDSVRVKQILINLLNNAIKFTHDKGAVGLDVFTSNDRSILYFTVWDTGIGIKEDDFSRLFKPFTQVSSNLSRDYEGTGLGLSLVAKLTEMHGGGVSVESEAGVGSKFTVALPVKSSMVEPQASDISNKTMQHIKKALIIEDFLDDISFLSDNLAKLNIESVVFRLDSVLEEVLESNDFDIVFLDILLWGHSGWDILLEIRKNPKYSELPVIVNSILKEKSRALAFGADGFLNKPYSPNALYEALHKIDVKIAKSNQNKINIKGLEDMTRNKPLILLAEDNEANLQTLEAFLEYAGFEVTIARNGKEAVESVVENKPDLALIDIQMPKMDGLEATRIIRQNKNFENLPIIALTALAMPGDKERCLSAGANTYISKPVNFDTLINSINSLLPDDKKTLVSES